MRSHHSCSTIMFLRVGYLAMTLCVDIHRAQVPFGNLSLRVFFLTSSLRSHRYTQALRGCSSSHLLESQYGSFRVRTFG